jgi:K+-sensing histidine kinase KdpD
MPSSSHEKILVIESDPVIADLIAVQALRAAGYQTEVVTDTATAIPKTLQLQPDVIIVNLEMPGLSGKDLLIALTSQHIETPVIVLARKGMESAIMQAYRLGATDYILWPVREAEVIAVTERVLKQVRERREHERMALQLEQTNKEYQIRMREMNTIFAVGKAVLSITDQVLLFDRILEGAISITSSDLGWLLLKNEAKKTFTLAAYQNLPASLHGLMNHTWDDGVSSLVAMSGEPLAFHGEALKKFKIAALGQAALIVPIKVQKQVVGLIVVMRRQALPFKPGEQNLVVAISDYASISLVNARLFHALEEKAASSQSDAGIAQVGERVIQDLIRALKSDLTSPLKAAKKTVFLLEIDKGTRWTPVQKEKLDELNARLSSLEFIVEEIMPEEIPSFDENEESANVNEIVRQAVSHFQHYAQVNRLAIITELPSEALVIKADAGLVGQALEGLISNAIKFNHAGGQVVVHVERGSSQTVKVTVKDTGRGIEPTRAAHIFEGGTSDGKPPDSFGGLGIGLVLIKEIITSQKGEIWVESKPRKGSNFYFSLPLQT